MFDHSKEKYKIVKRSIIRNFKLFLAKHFDNGAAGDVGLPWFSPEATFSANLAEACPNLRDPLMMLSLAANTHSFYLPGTGYRMTEDNLRLMETQVSLTNFDKDLALSKYSELLHRLGANF